MIKDVDDRFDDYSILPNIRQIILHWGYELVESDMLWFVFFFNFWQKFIFFFFNIFMIKISFLHTKMSYYFFNGQELLQKVKDRYHNCGGKEKAAECYIENKEFLK